MKIEASVSSTSSSRTVEVETDGRTQSLGTPRKIADGGSTLHGGELLAALTTSLSNDLCRRASKPDISVEEARLKVWGTFGGPCDPARDISYRVEVGADGP